LVHITVSRTKGRSEIKTTQNVPPFLNWWETGADIVDGWKEIQKQRSARPNDKMPT